MEELNDLYENGVSYREYVEAGEEEVRQKHLHYLDKMELSEEEKRRFESVAKDSRKYLVFCDLYCNDCRIALAVLENLRNAFPKQMEYRIVSRRGQEDLMRRLGGSSGIPLIVDMTKVPARVVFREFPDVLADEMADADTEGKDRLIMEFRKGMHKEEILKQLMNSR